VLVARRREFVRAGVALWALVLGACSASPPGSAGTGGTTGAGVGAAGVSGGGASGAAGGAPAGGTGGGGVGGYWAKGNVRVLQPDGSAAPIVSTTGRFAAIVSCTGTSQGTPGACRCTTDMVDGCLRRRCNGDAAGQTVTMSDLLGYTAIVDDILATTPVDVGTLTVSDGARTFSYAPNYVRTDNLPGQWTPGQTITVATSGAEVPGFAVEIPFPPRVTFEPLPAPPYPDRLDVRWTPTMDAPGFVEAVSAFKSWPDARYSFSVIACTAPISAGHLMLPLDGAVSTSTPVASRAIAVRVVNGLSTGAPGLMADVFVESYDTGVLDDVPVARDAAAD
jgi:hypothetical protein